MSDQSNSPGDVRPRTAVLTRGFDPSLSFGSARPAVFRSWSQAMPMRSAVAGGPWCRAS
jgi:hypothetical protein